MSEKKPSRFRYLTQITNHPPKRTDLPIIYEGKNYNIKATHFYEVWKEYLRTKADKAPSNLSKKGIIKSIVQDTEGITITTLEDSIDYVLGDRDEKDRLGMEGLFKCFSFLGEKLKENEYEFVSLCLDKKPRELQIFRTDNSLINDMYSWGMQLLNFMCRSYYYNYSPDGTGKDYYLSNIDKMEALMWQDTKPIEEGIKPKLRDLLDELRYIVQTYDFPNIPKSWLSEFPEAKTQFFDAVYKVCRVKGFDPEMFAFVPTHNDIISRKMYFGSKPLVDEDTLYQSEACNLFDNIFHARFGSLM